MPTDFPKLFLKTVLRVILGEGGNGKWGEGDGKVSW